LLFVTGPGKSSIENHFDINEELIRHLRLKGQEDLLAQLAFERDEARYFFTRQRRQLGLGHAILCAEPFIRGNRFVIALGDTILGRHTPSKIVQKMIDLYENNAEDIKGVIAFDEVAAEEVCQYGIAKPKETTLAAGNDGCFELDDLIEKPMVTETPSRLAVAARYVFSPEIFAYLHKTEPGVNGEIQLTDAVRLMLRDGRCILGIRLPAHDERYDIGSMNAYFRAFRDFTDKDG